MIITAALAATLTIAPTIGAPPPPPLAPGAQSASYILAPHPDDEWQGWSYIENSPGNYKVFVLLTRGEESGYCDNPVTAPPAGTNGRWSEECATSRVVSWLGFLTAMSGEDPTIPGDWGPAHRTAPFPTNGTALNRVDGGVQRATTAHADVYVDQGGRGAAVVFDLGDGDLTDAETIWAFRTVLNNRAALGIDTTLPNWNAIGPYYNRIYPGCTVYAHADHYAVHRALYHTDFGLAGYQAAPTCRTDPDVFRSRVVTQPMTEKAWAPGGHFRTAYSWLRQDWAFAWNPNQSTTFMQYQSFWHRH